MVGRRDFAEAEGKSGLSGGAVGLVGATWLVVDKAGMVVALSIASSVALSMVVSMGGVAGDG